MKRLASIAVVTLLATSCATTPTDSAHRVSYRPVIDTQEVDLNKMDVDMRNCARFTGQRMSAGQGAATGAVVGGLLGGVLMTAITGNSDFVGRGMAAGAVGGALGGASEAHGTQKQIMRRCMTGRGYTVLD